MKVLVTGATGSLGRAVLKDLHDRGYETRSLLHATAIDRRDNLSHTEIVWGDLSREQDHADYVKGCDAVVHCAWSFVRGDYPDQYQKINIDPAISLMRAAYQQGVCLFVTISSVSVYGLENKQDGKPFTEKDDFCSYDDALDIYPRTKQKAERDMTTVANELSMPLVIVRPGLLYSDSVPPVKKSIKGKVSLMAGFGNNFLPYVHTTSVAELIGDIISAPPKTNEPEVFNAVPAHSDTARAVYMRWKKQYNSNAKTVYLPAPVFEALALAPFYIKKLLKKKSIRPNSVYQTRTGTRNVDYSAEHAKQVYGWIGY